MKDIMGEDLECKVIFSGSQNDKPHLKEHHTTSKEQEEILKEFKKGTSESKLCFIIVKDMLLTGFDAPIEQVMYLDRPLKEYTLLQAIARVNRTCGDRKKCGYVIDYYGVLDFLEEALNIFDKEELGSPMESMDSLHNDMLSYRENVMRMFTGVDKNNIDELVKVIEPEDKRAEFEVAYKKFAGAVDSLMPGNVSKDILNDVKWLSYIRAAAKMRYNPQDKLDIFIEKVKSKASWIIQKQYEVAPINNEKIDREAVSGESYMYLGRNYSLDIVMDEGTLDVEVKLFRGKFVVRTYTKDEEVIRGALGAWYRAKTLDKVKERVKYYEGYFKDVVKDIKVKEQKKRWASCTASNILLFNWRCVMAKSDVLDYIVVHELCHMEHKDHSKAFWDRVSYVMPDYEVRRQWLKENGIKLDL